MEHPVDPTRHTFYNDVDYYDSNVQQATSMSPEHGIQDAARVPFRFDSGSSPETAPGYDADEIRQRIARIVMAGGDRAVLALNLLREKANAKRQSSEICKFCRNNNEEDFKHEFKDEYGRVVCPVLSKHVCELCGASGHAAHTRKYCTLNPLTLGEPERLGFPPGILPLDIYDTTMNQLKTLSMTETPPLYFPNRHEMN